ncbi:MAG: acyl-CoA dehydrogenase family protein [Burkholderiales bacterium]|nr:acyl-CoA dehydrogenase family protein [Burkholderiales bacterium]
MTATDAAAADAERRRTLIEAARALVPTLGERAVQTERDRRIARATHEAFVAAGFYRIHQPKRFGGSELGLSMMIDLAAELGRGCGSSCWVFTNLAVQNLILGIHYPQTQEEVWGNDGNALIASSFPAKGGTTRKVDGGIVCDGLWSFASGVDYADWNNMQVFVPQEGGPPQHRFALVPRAQYEVIDDWNVAGLAGTGSKSIRLKECFIPEHRTLPTTLILGGVTPGSALNPSALYRIPPLTLGTKVFAGPALGIARGALMAMEDELRTRKNVAGAPMCELPTTQVRIAEAGAEIAAAWALLVKDCDDALAIVSDGTVPDIDTRARWRLNNAFAGQLCLRAVERLHPLIGARGLDPDSHFLRAWRDIHAAVLQFTMAWDVQAVNAGRIRFGLPSLDPRV